MTIDLQEVGEGLVLPVRAQPGARSNGIRGEHAGALKVAVTQVPEKGKANKAIIAVLARQLQLTRSQIKLLAGVTTGDKRFLISGISRAELVVRIEQALAFGTH